MNSMIGIEDARNSAALKYWFVLRGMTDIELAQELDTVRRFADTQPRKFMDRFNAVLRERGTRIGHHCGHIGVCSLGGERWSMAHSINLFPLEVA
jgi:hypothetical protein